MTDPAQYFITTAIDYPNSRPHIGTAFEKLGADVQARYRRMQGYEVFFLMGNDENTVKVSRRAAELGLDTKAYCDDMATQFKEVWRALDISFDDFIQTSEPRHHQGCRTFIQKVYDNGHIYKGTHEGWYCDDCEEFKSDKVHGENAGNCPTHRKPLIRRSEACYKFALSTFRDQLLAFYDANPDFIQPESRRNEVVTLVQTELLDVNISRSGEDWGIRIPFDEAFTIYVWFDALLNYITAIGYGRDAERFNFYWPADLHVIGKDITRFHCALWPAMCFAAGIKPPKRVFGHGFVYRKNEETGEVQKIGKAMGNAVEPMEVITKFSSEAFRYYFLAKCPFPEDGEFGWAQFALTFNADLANNLGNLYSRVMKLVGKNHGGVLDGTAGTQAPAIVPDLAGIVRRIQDYIEGCRYNMALQTIWLEVLNPANKYLEDTKPWALFKSDPTASKTVLDSLVEVLRCASILIKPFLPRSAETIYRAFEFEKPWEAVRYEDALPGTRAGDVAVVPALRDGKVPPMFPRIDTREG